MVVNDASKPFLNYPFINTEWKLTNVTVSPNEENNFVWLEFKLHLKRNHAFYVNHMIFPFAILSSLSKSPCNIQNIQFKIFNFVVM